MIKLGIIGKNGRMGTAITNLISQTPYSDRFTLFVGAGRNDFEEKFSALLSCDVIVDFSHPDASLNLLARLEKTKTTAIPCLVIGTTGWNEDFKKTLTPIAKRTPTFIAANFSLGIALLNHTLRQISPLFKKMDLQPTIIETHHKHKLDSPSGTALALKASIHTGVTTPIPIHSIRAGEILGEHEIRLFGSDEIITFSHTATHRSLFAKGALAAADWVASKRGQTAYARPFEMADLIGETLFP